MGNLRYDALTEDGEESAMKLLYISTSKYEGDWNSIKHTHPFSELFYVLSGKGSFCVESEDFLVGTDDLVIVNPNISHTELSYHSEPLEYIVLGIKGLEFSSDYSRFSYHNNNQEILFYFRRLLQEIELKDTSYEIVCRNLLEILIIYLQRQQSLTFSIKPVMKLTKECSQIQRFLDSNYAENITLDMLSNLTHMNKYYLAHAFTKHTGVSPINYLIKKRIEEAKNLLSATDYSVAQIALSVGFSSHAYFAQVFKKEVGISPISYRKQSRKDKSGSV